MTQKYDKVVWQDETTSQQGTLINAERLDQMQTAHHYADGFEEVDEVPTEDPGVDYHKVVYCTADTTFYRWNGEEWTKDVDDDTKALLLAHEADHANPHVVTKAQVGLGNCDNTSDLAKPISTATQTALDAKVDDSQIKSSWSSPLSNDNIPSEKLVKDTLDTKADKATTLAGYGITDAVDLNTVQTIEGNKFFKNTAATTVSSAAPKGAISLSNLDMSSPFPGNRYIFKDCVVDGNGTLIQGLRLQANSAQSLIMAFVTTKADGTSKAFKELTKYDRTTDTWTDTMVQNDLDAYTPMVRTTGAQTIAGEKTFNNPLTINSDGVSTALFVKTKGNYRIMQLTTKDYDVTDGAQHFLPSILTLNDKNDVVLFRIGAYSFPNGRVQIKLYARNSDGTYKVATLIEGDTIA